MNAGVPWRAALVGRLAYVTHRMARHAVLWRSAADARVNCPGDIVCCTCNQVLWCRAHDPWRPSAPDSAHPGPDHWVRYHTDGDGAAPLPLDPIRARRLLGARQDALMEALTRGLELVERLPAGRREDEVRRSFCELIEALDAGTARDARIARLLSWVGLLRQARAGQDTRAAAADVERFASVVRAEVLPLLARFDGARDA
jgi:hypothetical protein